MTISAVIITFNEEANIARCLQSVQAIADEIIVVDSNSTDRTAAISASLGARVVLQPFLGYVEQKNFAAGLATGDYVLSLDADELLGDALQQWLQKEKQAGLSKDVYVFSRLNNYCGQWIRHGDYFPDRKLRLWKKGIGAWGGENPHDRFMPNGTVTTQMVKHPILHYSYSSYEEHVQQANRFSSIAAKAMFARGKKVSMAKPFFSSFWSFLNGYVFKLGFLDGFNGYMIAITNAYYTFLKYAKLRQMK